MTADLIPDPPAWDKYESAPEHRFEADPLSLQGDCAFCGLPHPDYGDEPALDYDVPAPSSCPSCPHYSHRGPCDALVSGWTQRVCGCRAVAA